MCGYGTYCSTVQYVINSTKTERTIVQFVLKVAITNGMGDVNTIVMLVQVTEAEKNHLGSVPSTHTV